MPDDDRTQRLSRAGVSRKQFLQFCGFMATTLALPAIHAKRIAAALDVAPRLPVVWLALQDCTGDSESFLRSGNPTFTSIILDVISLDYHETLMTPSGANAEKSLMDTINRYPGQYVAIVEGAVPTGLNGFFCSIGGRSGVDILRQVTGSALKTIAVGSCAWEGGWPGAKPNPTGARGVKDAIPGVNIINLPGCPMNGANLAGVFVHYLTNGVWPETDDQGRPLFAYGETIHGECPRKPHYDRREFVQEWGDAGHQAGWCLFMMGCNGPGTKSNCATIQWNGGTSWPIGSGHHCLGCTRDNFWDTMSPFYVQTGTP